MRQYYRCSYLLIFAIQSQWNLTITSYHICFLSLYCSIWLLHTQLKQKQSRRILSLGDSPVFELYFPTFRNILSVPSSCLNGLWRWNSVPNEGKCTSEGGESPKRKNTIIKHGESLKSRNKLSFLTVTPNLYSTVITIRYSPYILPMSETA